jgi:hypothetical protein
LKTPIPVVQTGMGVLLKSPVRNTFKQVKIKNKLLSLLKQLFYEKPGKS